MSEQEFPETETPVETIEEQVAQPEIRASDAAASQDVLQNLAAHANLDFLLDVPLQVTVELGRCKITIAELLNCCRNTALSSRTTGLRSTSSATSTAWRRNCGF